MGLSIPGSRREESPRQTETERLTLATSALHIFVLTGFAVAQPLFDLLARNPPFLVAHRARALDLIALILALVFVAPSLLVIVESAAALGGRAVRRVVHAVLVATLVALIALPPLKRLDSIPGLLLLIGAGLVGALVALAYYRWRAVRTFLSVLSPALVLFPALFLLAIPIRKIAFPGPAVTGAFPPVEAQTSVIIVVFDELPVTALLDEARRIDAERYPNFAELARRAHWFRNATTVADHTHVALPALLTGNYPPQRKLPSATDYPDNLFTWLALSHQLNVYESITGLCPERRCGIPSEGFRPRFTRLSIDLAIVYGHVVLPVELTEELPDISHQWRDFAGGDVQAPPALGAKTRFGAGILGLVKAAVGELNKDRAEVFRDFIGQFEKSRRPSLHFLHILLPHSPWVYLPSGKKYDQGWTRTRGLTGEWWGKDRQAVEEGFQRFLLQVGFADQLLGELIDRLESEDLFEDALLIIAADHGVSFREGDSRRYVTRSNFPDVMTIPLLIKLPGQDAGSISDRNAEIIDVLPTIADVLGSEVPWPVDGSSLVDPLSVERPEKRIFGKQTAERELVFEPTMVAKWAALERQHGLFGSGAWKRLFESGQHRELIGVSVDALDTTRDEDLQVVIDQQHLFARVDPQGSFVPALVTGRINGLGRYGTASVGVAVNGTIQAVGRQFVGKADEDRFAVMVPETSFRAGRNRVEILIVPDGPERIVLSRQVIPSKESYSIARESSGNLVITSAAGHRFPVVDGALKAYLDQAKMEAGGLQFSGWAAGRGMRRPADRVVLFVNGVFGHTSSCDSERPDLVRKLKRPELNLAGFRFVVSDSLVAGKDRPVVRLYAIADGVASEVQYPTDYPW